MLLVEELSAAYEDQMRTREQLFRKNEAEISAKTVLATKKSELMMSGSIIGKNAESRDAQLCEMTKEETNLLRLAECDKRTATLAYELASMKVDMNRDLIRLMGLGRA
jgi:hypothetical protein